MAACRIAGSKSVAWITLRSQKSGEKYPDNLGAVNVRKKYSNRCSAGSRLGLGEGYFAGDDGDFREPSEGLTGAYPSHFRPVEVHLLQHGFSSPHLTLRILLRCQPDTGTQMEAIACLLIDLLAGNTSCP